MKPDGEEESPLLKTDAAFVRILIRLPRRHAVLLQTPGEIPPSMSNLRYSIAAGSEGAFQIHLPCGLEISFSVLPGLSGFPASWPNPFPQRSKGDFFTLFMFRSEPIRTAAPYFQQRDSGKNNGGRTYPRHACCIFPRRKTFMTARAEPDGSALANMG